MFGGALPTRLPHENCGGFWKSPLTHAGGVGLMPFSAFAA